MSTAKVITIVHPSSAVNNIVNDSSGNVAVGNNLTVAGSSTITGNETVTGTLTVGGAAVVAVAPTATGNVVFSTNGTTWSSTAKIVQGTAVSTATTSFTGATSGISTTLTASSITGTIAIGQVIAGTGIAAGTTITAGSGTSWTISPASTGTVSGTITVVGVDFLSIPSWVKRVTVMFTGVSTNGTSARQVQLGVSGSAVASGYVSSGSLIGTSVLTSSSTSGFYIYSISAADLISGQMTITNTTGNTWVASYALKIGSSNTGVGGGDIALAGTLNMVRITTAGGTDTFDAGSINILYE